MRTRARAWAIRAAVVAVVAAAGVVGIHTPAYAADVVIHSFSMNPPTIDAGQESRARFRINLNPDGAGNVNLTVSSNNPKVECISGCSIGGAQIPEGGSDYFEAVFRAQGIFTSEETVTITVQAADASGGPTRSANQPLRVRPTPTVPEVRGTVTDVYTGEPVKDARVGMVDSVGNTWDNIGTGADGSFVITSTPQKPIAAGKLRFTVQKEGIRDFDSDRDSGPIVANPNVPLVGVSLRVMVLATATPTGPPTGPPTDEVSGSPGQTSEAAAPPPDTGLSGFAIMMIVIGGLLVLVGIGAIVLLFVRRNNEEEDQDGPPGPGGRGVGRHPRQPGHRQLRVQRQVAAAGLPHRQDGGDHRRTAGQAESHRDVRADPGGAQQLGELVAVAGEPPVGQPVAVGTGHRHRVRIRRWVPVQQFGDRGVRRWFQPVGRPGGDEDGAPC